VDFDIDGFRALNQAGSNPVLDGIALLLDVSALLYIIILWAVQFWVVKKRTLAFDYVVALLIAVAFTEIVKFAIDRKRPEMDPAVWPVHILTPAFFPDFVDPSFPSGHTSRAFVLVAVFGLHHRKWLVGLLPYGIAVGLARVYEGAHYPTDVIAGAILGFAIGAMFWWLDSKPEYVALRKKLIGRWLSPSPGARSGSSSPPGRAPPPRPPRAPGASQR